MNNPEPPSSSFWTRNATLLFVIALLVFVVIYMSTPWLVGIWTGDCAIEKRGQFGDQFGALNALVSTFAMLALIYTIFQQRNELNRAEERWREERSELSRQHRADMVVRMVDRLVDFRRSLQKYPSFRCMVVIQETNVATSVEYIRENYMKEAGKIRQAVE